MQGEGLARVLGKLVFAALVLAASAALAHDASLPGKIAYVNQHGQLAVVDPHAGEPRLLTPIGTTYRFPSFAPTGDGLAAIGDRSRTGFVHVFEDEALREVYRSDEEKPIYLYWSPDGGALSFIATRAETGLGLWIAERSGDALLVASGNPFYWSWSPDSTSFLAHVGLTGDGARLAFGDRGGAGLAQEDLDPPGWFQAPGVAPSGRWIAYTVAAPGGQRRVVMMTHPQSREEPVRREFVHEGFAMLGWNPARDLLAVMAPSDPAPHWFGPIQLLHARDGFLELLVDEVALAFFWSPDGSKLAYVTPEPTEEVQQVVAPIYQGPVRLQLHVVYVDAPEGSRVRTLGSFTPSLAFVDGFLPFFDQYAQSHRVWSPASDALVLPAVGRDGVTRVTVFGLDGTQRPLARGDMPVWNVR